MQRHLYSRIILTVILNIGAPVFGQPRGTDIYLFNYTCEKDRFVLENMSNITNRPGYDNQPFFIPTAESVLFSSIRGDGQADIYRYDIETGATTRLTETTESEYSPTIMPGGDHFSVVRVETDGTQRLWQFDMDGHNPELILKNIKPVGYHAWANESTAVLFILGDPHELHLVDLLKGKSEHITGDIGRCLIKIPKRHAFGFTQRGSEDSLRIKILDYHTKEITSLFPCVDGNEFFAWLNNGAVLMGSGTKLYLRMPGRDKNWREVYDFSSSIGLSISRITLNANGDKMAIVFQETQ